MISKHFGKRYLRPINLLSFLSVMIIFILTACNKHIAYFELTEESETIPESILLVETLSDLETELEPELKAEQRLTILPQRNTISLSEGNSAIIMSDGSLWVWGSNHFGELGYDTINHSIIPVRVGSDTDWASVSIGGGVVTAVKADGTLWTWGVTWDDIFTLTLGPSANIKAEPKQLGIDTDWVNVTTGGFHVLALKSDGSLWAWGVNRSGELGDGTTTNRSAPVQIGTDTDWAIISAGSMHSMALKKDGSLWAWGHNSGGQFGDGSSALRTTPRQTTPVQIGTDTDWVNITTSGSHTIALKSDGTLWTWGSNRSGPLGDGTTTNNYVPTKVGTSTDWVSISADAGLSLAIKSDGSLWAWGSNTRGYLGIEIGLFDSWRYSPEFDRVLSPVQIGTDTDWVNIVASNRRILGTKVDGSVWSWGWIGESGATIGDGTRESSPSPVRIMDGNTR